MTEISGPPAEMRARRYLVLAEDARRYLVLAEDARRGAAACNGELREHYVFLAEQWEKLAGDLAEYLNERPDAKQGTKIAPLGHHSIIAWGNEGEMDDELQAIAEYKARAEEARHKARSMQDLGMIQIMEQIAADYETMAEMLHAIHRSKQALERRKSSK